MVVLAIVTYSADVVCQGPQPGDPLGVETLSSGIYSQCFAKLPGVGSEGLELIAPQLSTTVAGAFNPVLAMLAIGVCTYLSSDSESSELPLPAQPWFLLSLGVFVVIFVLKDYLLALFPVVKMPLNYIEAVVQAASQPLAVTFFMTSLAGSMQSGDLGTSASLLSVGQDFTVLQAGLGSTLGGLLGGVLVFAGLAYILVFALALHFLIALCPVPILDTALKYIRNAICVLLVLASLISPVLGLIFLGLVAYMSYKFSDSAFRSATAGFFYLLANLSRKQKRFDGLSWAATRGLPGAKKNVVGKFSMGDQGICQFAYRPYLVFKTRVIKLHCEDFALKKTFTSLVLMDRSGASGKELLALPSAYSDALSEKYESVSFERQKLGFAGGLRWFKDQFKTPTEAS